MLLAFHSCSSLQLKTAENVGIKIEIIGIWNCILSPFNHAALDYVPVQHEHYVRVRVGFGTMKLYCKSNPHANENLESVMCSVLSSATCMGVSLALLPLLTLQHKPTRNADSLH